MKDEEICRLILDACYESYKHYGLGKTLHSGMLATLLDVSQEEMKQNVLFLADEKDFLDAHRLLTTNTHFKIVLSSRGVELIESQEKYNATFAPVPAVKIYFKKDSLYVDLPHPPKATLSKEELKALPIVQHLDSEKLDAYLKNLEFSIGDLKDPDIDITDKEEAKSLVFLIRTELTKPEVVQNIRRIRQYLERIGSFPFSKRLPVTTLNALWDHFR